MKFRHNNAERSTSARFIRWGLVTMAILVVISGVSFYVAYNWYQSSLEPVASEQQAGVPVVIVEGSSVDEIANTLFEAGLIRNTRAFSIYVDRLGVRDKLQAGVYKLSPAQSVEEIVDDIVNGRVDTSLITVIPGYRLDEVADLWVEQGFSEEEVEAAISATYNHPVLAFKPENADLEGYIYPETFEITSTTKLQDLIVRHFDELNALLTPSFIEALEAQGLTVHEAIILASIIQNESSDPDDQPQIAQVFLKRLDEGIKLGADATFFYASAVAGEEPSVNIDSPYNTRIYEGLPPGPISNFNASALEAVAFPADGDFLYFVSGDDGNTYFSRTLEEHEALTAEHCIELCKIGSE